MSVAAMKPEPYPGMDGDSEFIQCMVTLHGRISREHELTPSERGFMLQILEGLTNIDTPEKLEQFNKLCSASFKRK